MPDMNAKLMLQAMLLSTLFNAPVSAQETAPAAADTFEREALKVLKASHEAKRGIVVHVKGEAIGGLVKAIGPDVVILSNREYSTILVRRDQIDAIESN
jgi:hypothetical protein